MSVLFQRASCILRYVLTYRPRLRAFSLRLLNVSSFPARQLMVDDIRILRIRFSRKDTILTDSSIDSLEFFNLTISLPVNFSLHVGCWMLMSN